MLKRKLAKAFESGAEHAKRDILLDIYKTRLKASKHPVPYHEFTPLLVEAYVGFKGIGDQQIHAPSLVDEAVRYCSPLVKDCDADIEPGDRKRPRKVGAGTGAGQAKQGGNAGGAVPVGSGPGDVKDLDDGGDSSDSGGKPEAPPSPPSRASSPGDVYMPGGKRGGATGGGQERKRVTKKGTL